MWQEDEEEDVRSCWMTLRTGEDTLIWRRRLWIALCGGIVLEEALDLSSDRLLNNNNKFVWSSWVANLYSAHKVIQFELLNISQHYSSCLQMLGHTWYICVYSYTRNVWSVRVKCSFSVLHWLASGWLHNEVAVMAGSWTANIMRSIRERSVRPIFERRGRLEYLWGSADRTWGNVCPTIAVLGGVWGAVSCNHVYSRWFADIWLDLSVGDTDVSGALVLLVELRHLCGIVCAWRARIHTY